MTIKKRAATVAQELERLYPSPSIPLHHDDAYTLLIAVMLSAQCTDARVNLVTPALFARASTPAAMARLSPEEVRTYIASCGLSERKAAAIVATSHLIEERHGGKVPSTFEELEALPGVGHKTAGVVMHQAFGHPAFPVDTHIYRLARKWHLSKGSNVVQVERDLKHLFPQSSWGALHLRIVLYGREYCPARGCGGSCPICTMLEPPKTPG